MKHINLKIIIILSFATTVFPFSTDAQNQDKPNILLFIIEDMSDFYLPAYGNNIVQTPNVDRLANTSNSVIFDNGYSNGAACSPARTTLITGIYSSALGAEQHRRDIEYPHEFFWTKLMQNAGYWTSNVGKTDYNIKNEDALLSQIWNNSNGTFQNAPANKPFFCIENNFDTHMSKITDTRDIANDRKNRTVALNEVNIPQYLPDLNLIRDDMAWYYERIKVMDNWLGNRLNALNNSGRADDTIIFFMADNGGSMSGSKAFLRQDGMKVPIIGYFPEKWKHLAPPSTNGRSNAIVEFVDFPKSILSIADVAIPDEMQGRIFLGENQEQEEDYAYGILANQGNYFIPSRAITDGNYKFIWHYNNFWAKGVRKQFQFQMPGFQAWENAYRNGSLSGVQADFWEPNPTFELFDLNADPGEVNNLANNANYANKLQEMKTALKQKIRAIKDIGFNPITLRDTITNGSYYEVVRDRNINMEAIYAAAELASEAEASDLNKIVENLLNANPTVRYWGAVGIASLAYHEKINTLPDEVFKFMNLENENIESRLMCAFAAASVGKLCEANKVFTSLASDKMTVVFLATLKDPSPFAQFIYDVYQSNTGSFPNRSALVNVGIMSYDDLIDPSSNPNLDLSILSASSVLDNCNQEALCADEQGDFFNESTLSNNWTLLNGTFNNDIEISNNRLKINYTSGNQGVEREFTPKNSDNTKLTFTINSERNWLRNFVLFKNQAGDTLGGIVIGNNENKFIATIANKESLRNNTPQIGKDILGTTFIKNIDYTIDVTFNFTNQTYDVSVEDFESVKATAVPFWSTNNPVNIGKFNFTLNSIFNNSLGIHLDNLILKEVTNYSQNFDTTYASLVNLIYNSNIGPEQEQYPESAYQTLYSYFVSLTLPDCNTSQNEYNSIESEITAEINKFLASKNSLSTTNFGNSNFELNIYPNPVKSNKTLSIQFNNKLSTQNFTFNLVDVTGKLVFSNRYHYKNKVTLSLPQNMKSGLYIATIKARDKTIKKKLIIQ